MRAIERIIIHHTEGANDTYEAVLNWQTTKDDPATAKVEGKGWSHVAYHRIIEQSGTTVKCYTETKSSGGTLKSSGNSLEVCLCGDFDSQDPTPSALTALKETLADWCYAYGIVPSSDTIVGHKDIQPMKGDHENKCPGENLHSLIDQLISFTAGELAKRYVADAAKKLGRR